MNPRVTTAGPLAMQSGVPSPVSQRSTQFAAREGDSAPPPELQAFGGVFAALWALLLGFLLLTRRRQRQLLKRSRSLQGAAQALPER